MATIRQRFDAFLAYFVGSPAMAELSEYYDAQQVGIGVGSVTASTVIPLQIPVQLSDSDVQNYLGTAIANGTVPAATANRLYVTVIPDGVSVDAPGVGSNCSGHCGYHSGNAGQYPYAVLCFMRCPECRPPPLTPFQALTAAASHEIREAVTNPFGTGWQNGGTEIGDICNTNGWQCYELNGYTIQRVWSNAQNGCV